MSLAFSDQQPACSADGQPYVPEDRRVKAVGLILLALTAPGAIWLSNHQLVDRWLTGTPEALAIVVAVFFVTVNLAAVGGLVLAIGLGVVRPLDDIRGRWAAALALLAANASIPLVGFSLLQEDATVERLGDGWVLLVVGLALALYVGILRLLRRSQQWVALSAAEALERDRRPPVVYLRAFTDDGQVAVAGQRWFDRFVGTTASSLVLTSAEQELAFILQRVGPVIAIGRPGEPLPELGAARLYVSHEAWQQEVLQMLERAALVLVRVGASPGVLWELDRVLNDVPRDRVVLLVLGTADALEAGLHAIEGRLGQRLHVPPLPAFRFRRVLAMLATDPQKSIGVLVGFDGSGRAFAESIPAMAFSPGDLARSSFMRPLAGPLRSAARRLFAAQGRAWHEPPRRWVAVGLALALGGFGAHWFYLGRRRRATLRLVLLPVIWLTLPYAWYEACGWLLADRRQFEQNVANGAQPS